ncbi:MAG: AAA family ATPase [Lutibacter sp.]
MRKFYSCSVGEENKGYDEENLSRIADKMAFVLHEKTPQKGDYEKIKKNDILLLKFRKKFIGYGEALEIVKSSDEEWNLFAPVKEWYFYNDLDHTLGIDIYGMQSATLKGSQYGTVKPLSSEFSIDKIKNINNKSQLFKTVYKEFLRTKEDNKMQKKIELLKYKKQIILQGPPGTGKTRMAKMLASELTKSKEKLSPFEYIDWYIRNFKSSKITRDRNLYRTNLLKEFTDEFPLERIKKMSLDEYCLGKGSTTSFCYWIERGLKDLGRFSPGPAGTTVYGVYYSQVDNKYISTSKTPDALLTDIQIALVELVEKEDYTKARGLFRQSFILKILISYYPEKYFPILSQAHLNSIANIFNIEKKSLNDIEINKKINDVFQNLKLKYSNDISNFNLMRHLYDKFKIKENQFDEELIDVVDELGETKLIQFHPAYSYEDFVRGIAVETNEKSQIEYKVVNKTLADFAEKALENPTANYVLIIDEINRANLPSVLGELIYALEYRYDENEQNFKEAAVESMYSLKQNEKDVAGVNTLLLPTNLFIIGTMNTADRSVGHIDYAIRRRFAFVDVLPTDTAIDDVVTEPILNKKAKDLYQKVAELFNEDKLKPVFLQSDFKAKEVQLGHSYFLVETDIQLQLKLEYEIKPLLNEYVRDGILSESALAEIDTL